MPGSLPSHVSTTARRLSNRRMAGCRTSGRPHISLPVRRRIPPAGAMARRRMARAFVLRTSHPAVRRSVPGPCPHSKQPTPTPASARPRPRPRAPLIRPASCPTQASSSFARADILLAQDCFFAPPSLCHSTLVAPCALPTPPPAAASSGFIREPSLNSTHA